MKEKKLALYTSSLGNYFFLEIRDLICQGLKKINYIVINGDENTGFIEDADWHIVLAPHEFFYLGKGNELRNNKLPENLVIINTEQPSTKWFSLSFSLFNKAKKIWDIDYISANSIRNKGYNSSYLPLGYIENFELFKDVTPLPLNKLTENIPEKDRFTSYLNKPWKDRPIDIIFIGNVTERRKMFFDKNKERFKKYNCFFDVYVADKPIIPGETTQLDQQTKIGLLQRSKILINIHRGEDIYLEWQRIVMHGIWQKCLVISEPCGYNPFFLPNKDYVECSLSEMGSVVEHFLSTEEGKIEADIIAQQGYKTLTTSCKIDDYLIKLCNELYQNDKLELSSHSKRVCFVNNVNPFDKILFSIFDGYFEFAISQVERCHVTFLHTKKFYIDLSIFSQCSKNVSNIFLPDFPFVKFEYTSPSLIESYLTYLWLRENNFDEVHFPDFNGVAYYCLVAKNQGLAFKETKLIIHSLDTTMKVLERKMVLLNSTEFLELDYIERKVYSLADLVIFPNKKIFDSIRKRGWVENDNYIFVKYPLPSELKKSIFKSKTTEISKVIFLCSGENLHIVKTIVSSILKLKREISKKLEFVFLIASNNGLNKSFQIEIEDKLKNEFIYKVKILNKNNLNKYLNLLNVMVVYSLNEYSYILEKLLIEGKPFVVNDIDTQPFSIELIKSYGNNPNILAKFIEEAYSNPEKFIVKNYFYDSSKNTFIINEINEKLIVNCKNIVDDDSIDKFPKVSVCLVSHNRDKYLRQAINSLLNQDYPNYEVILVDDGSNDPNLLEYLTELEELFKRKNWLLIKQDNRYLGAARNKAAKFATGEYLLFMDDDNIAKPNEISTFVKAAINSKADILTCLADTFLEDENPFDNNYIPKRWLHVGGSFLLGLFKNCYGDANALVRKEVFDELGGFHEIYGVTHEDWQFFSKAVIKGYKLEIVPEGLFFYRITKGSMIKSTNYYYNFKQTIKPYEELIPSEFKNLVYFAVGLNLKKNELINELINSKNILPIESFIKSASLLIENGFNDAAKLILVETIKYLKLIKNPENLIEELIKIAFAFLKIKEFSSVLEIVEIAKNVTLKLDPIYREKLELLENSAINKVTDLRFEEGKLKVSIIIPTFNQINYTVNCIDSLFDSTSIPFELIVVDNNSTDQTKMLLENLKRMNSNVKIIFNNENKGFPKSINQGLLSAEGNFIVIANNDIVFTEKWLERMIEIAKSNSQIGIVAPISNEVSGLQKDENANYKSIEEMHKYAAEVREKNKGQVLYFPRVAFLCTLIKKDVIEKIGGLDERFSPGNYEDDDFCLRAQLAGFKTVIARDVFIHHFGSKSFKANGLEAYKKRLETNRNIFVDKWGATPEEIWLQNKPIKNCQIYYPINKDLFKQYFERTRIHLADNELKLAQESVIKAIENFEQDDSQIIEYGELLNLAGNIFLADNNFDKAQEFFEKELNHNPQSSSACYGLGQVFLARENFEAAKVMFEWAVKNNPESKVAKEALEKVNEILGYEISHSSLDGG